MALCPKASCDSGSVGRVGRWQQVNPENRFFRRAAPERIGTPRRGWGVLGDRPGGVPEESHPE